MKIPLIVVILLFSLFSSGCQQTGIHSYRAPMDESSLTLSDSVASAESILALQWTVPDEWHTKEASSMRLASYDAHKPAGDLDFSVVKLSGAAGGLQSNLNRWAGQVGVDTSVAPVKTQSLHGKLPYKMAYIQGLDKSILVAIFEHENESWFFKGIGSKEAVQSVKLEFETWVKSVGKRHI